MFKQSTFVIGFLLTLSSCTRGRLSDEDLKWIPYKGDESLYFKSSKGDYDSIKLFPPDRYYAKPENNALINLDTYDIYEIGFSYSCLLQFDTFFSQSCSVNNFVSLQAEAEQHNEVWIEFNIMAKDAELQPESAIRLNEFKNLPTMQLKTLFGTFSDVVTIVPEKMDAYDSNKNNYITKVYWSKSRGLVRYDKKDCFWELEKIGAK